MMASLRPNGWISSQESLHPVFSEWYIVSLHGQHALRELSDLRMSRRKAKSVLKENPFGKLLLLGLGKPLKGRECIFSAFSTANTVVEGSPWNTPVSRCLLG